METPLAQQSPEAVIAKEELIIAFVQEAFPTLDMSPGTALRDLVIRIYAHLETRMQEQIDLALISSSLLEITRNPTAVDDTQVDRLLSNYNVSRSVGSSATGKLRLFLTSNDSVVINADSEIIINNVIFKPVSNFLLLASNAYTAAANQRLIIPSGTVYTTTIDVIALEPGSAGNVRAGSLVASFELAPDTFISAKADSDFIGGLDSDDNFALLNKLRNGVVGKMFSGREHIKAKLKNEFAGIIDVGCVGFMDPEMRRDLVNGVHMGGRVDLFVKSAAYPTRIQEQIVPRLVSFNSADKEGLFEIILEPDKASGLYLVESIRSLLTQAGSYEIVEDIRSLGDSGNHYIEDVTKSAFSAFQRVKIQFVVPFEGMTQAWSRTDEAAPTPTTFLANLQTYIDNQLTQAYYKFYIEYLRMPNLQEIQSYVDLASERSLSADMLVHAPVPVLCSLQLRLLKKSGSINADLPKLKSALTSEFNSYGFGETIPGSALIHTAYENLPDGYAIDLPIHLYGVLINPDLSKDVLFSSDTLRPPMNSAKGVSPNNIAFFLESNLIDISIKEC